jgi:hypothetical protein
LPKSHPSFVPTCFAGIRGAMQVELTVAGRRVAFSARNTQYSCMEKRGRVLIAVVAVAVLATLVWTLLARPSEPVYKGGSLSYWLIQRTDSNSKAERDEAATAIRAMGTNAIPTLLRMMRAKESRFKSRWLARRWYGLFEMHFSEPAGIVARAEEGFDVLGTDAASAVPELSKILDETLSPECASRTANALGNIGPDGRAAVPSLLRAATKTKGTAHYEAFWALGKIHADPGSAVPVLLGVVSNTPADRMYAVHALGEYRGDARTAVPTLVALLNDPNVKAISPYGTGFVSDRSEVENALKQIDPETYARVVTNTPAYTNADH